MKIDPVIIDAEEIERIRKAAENAVMHAIRKIPIMIEEAVKGSVKSYLGIKEGTFGRIEISSNSPLKRLIDRRAYRVIEDMVGTLKWEPTIDELKEVRVQALKSYHDSLQRFIMKDIKDLADSRARSYIKEFGEMEISIGEPVVLPTVNEMANPEYGKTELQKALMEAQMTEIMAKEKSEPSGA